LLTDRCISVTSGSDSVAAADYTGEHADYADQLRLTRLTPRRAWYAAAYDRGRLAGHAWSFLDGELAGVFDIAVWPPFRRRKLGTGLGEGITYYRAGG
jgi:hypothetical protein